MIQEVSQNQKNFTHKEQILKELKAKGFRLTSQRKLILDVILENKCSNSKEIYYLAKQKDSSVGIATIYRMIKTLEEIGMMDRRNLYHISCEKTEKIYERCILVLKNSEQICLTTEDFKQALKQVLKNKGYHTEELKEIFFKI